MKSLRRSVRRVAFPAVSAAALATAIPPVPAADPFPPAVHEAFQAWRSSDYDYKPPAPGSYELADLGRAGDGKVLDADGHARRLHELARGRVVVLSFIYTRCPDPKACILATGVLSELRRMSALVPGLSERLLLVSLSFDPAHDTPEVMERYGRVASASDGEGAEWLFLTTPSTSALRPLLEAYGQRVDPNRGAKPGASGGAFHHPLRVYLIDGRHRLRNIYSYGLFDPRLVFTDIATLLDQEPLPHARLTAAPEPDGSR